VSLKDTIDLATNAFHPQPARLLARLVQREPAWFNGAIPQGARPAAPRVAPHGELGADGRGAGASGDRLDPRPKLQAPPAAPVGPRRHDERLAIVRSEGGIPASIMDAAASKIRPQRQEPSSRTTARFQQYTFPRRGPPTPAAGRVGRGRRRRVSRPTWDRVRQRHGLRKKHLPSPALEARNGAPALPPHLRVGGRCSDNPAAPRLPSAASAERPAIAFVSVEACRANPPTRTSSSSSTTTSSSPRRSPPARPPGVVYDAVSTVAAYRRRGHAQGPRVNRARPSRRRCRHLGGRTGPPRQRGPVAHLRGRTRSYARGGASTSSGRRKPQLRLRRGHGGRSRPTTRSTASASTATAGRPIPSSRGCVTTTAPSASWAKMRCPLRRGSHAAATRTRAGFVRLDVRRNGGVGTDEVLPSCRCSGK